jgi:excinuclease ABC subunit A
MYGLSRAGMRLEIDPNLIIPDNSKSINEGAIAVLEWNNSRFDNGYYWQQLLQVASAYDIDLEYDPFQRFRKIKMKINFTVPTEPV